MTKITTYVYSSYSDNNGGVNNLVLIKQGLQVINISNDNNNHNNNNHLCVNKGSTAFKLQHFVNLQF